MKDDDEKRAGSRDAEESDADEKSAEEKSAEESGADEKSAEEKSADDADAAEAEPAPKPAPKRAAKPRARKKPAAASAPVAEPVAAPPGVTLAQEKAARRALTTGATLAVIGLLLVGIGPSDAGMAISLAGLIALIYGIHTYGRLGPEPAK